MFDRRLRRGRATAAVLAVSGLVAGLLSATAAQAATTAPAARPVVAPVRQAPAVVGGARVTEELRGLRTATSRTYALADGTRRTDFFAGPVNYKTASGQLQPIDDTLVANPVPSTGWHNQANGYQVDFPTNLTAPITATQGSASVSLGLAGAAASPGTVTGATVTYTNALPGVTAAYTAGSTQIKESLSLASAAATGSFSFDLGLPAGSTVTSAPGGGLAIADGAGKLQARLSAPFMTDAAGVTSNAVTLTAAPSADGYRLSMTADPGWLGAAGRAWPVAIDPTVGFSTTFTGPYPDCTLAQVNPTTSTCGGTTDTVGWDGAHSTRTLLDFTDLTTVIPNHDTTILNAKLTTYMPSRTGTDTVNVSAYPLSHTYTTSATWNTYDGTHAWGTAGGDFATTPVVADTFGSGAPSTGTWFPTPLVQAWVSGTTANDGFMVKETVENQNDSLTFAGWHNATSSHWPALAVTYSIGAGSRGSYKMISKTLDDHMKAGVNVASGNLMVTGHDLGITGTGLNLAVDRYYNQQGEDWTYSFDTHIQTFTDGSVGYFNTSGNATLFTPIGGGSFTTPPGVNAVLSFDGVNTYTLVFNGSKEKQVFFEYDNWCFGCALLTSDSDRNGNTITYNRGATSGNLTSIVDTQGRTVTVANNTNGYETGLSDASGRNWGYTRPNGSTHPNDIGVYTDPAGGTTKYSYNGLDQLSQITDPDGHVTAFGYDTEGRLTSLTQDPSGVDAITGLVYNTGAGTTCPTGTFANTVVTDPNTHTTTYCMDSSDRVTKSVDALGHTQSSTYNSNSDPLTLTNGVSAVTTRGYDTLNNLTSIQAPSSNGTNTAAQSTLSYPSTGLTHQPTSSTDAQSNCTAYAYDTAGNQTTATPGLAHTGSTPPCSPGSGAGTATNKYQGDPGVTSCGAKTGELCSSVDANGHATSYGYDTNGNVTSITPPSPLGATTLTPDSLSRTAAVKDGNANTTSYAHDPLDRITAVAYAPHATISVDATVSVNGTGTTATTPGLTTAAAGELLVASVSADGPTGTQAVTVTGAGLTWSQVAESNTQHGDAEIWTALAASTLSGATVTSTETAGGYHQALTVTAYAGAAGAGVTATGGASSGGPSVTLTPSVTGSVIVGAGFDWDTATGRTVGTGQTLGHQWVNTSTGDTMWAQSVNATATAGSAVNLNDTAPTGDRWDLAAVELVPSKAVTYTYDPDGNILARVDATGTTTFAYDALNRLTKQTTPASPTNTCTSPNDTGITFGYDAASNLTSYCDVGGTVTYGYDNANRLKNLAEPTGSCTGTVSLCTTFGYNNADQRTTTTYPNPYPNGVTQTAAYDNAGNLTSISSAKSGTAITGLTYTWAVGTNDQALRQSVTDTVAGTTTHYAYDTQDRLCWAYVGTTTNTCTTPPTGATSYLYDNVGNRTSQTAGGVTTAYTYNNANELTSGPTTPVYDADGNQKTSPANTAITYNNLNQTTGITPHGVATTSFTYNDIDSTARASSTTSGVTTSFINSPLGVDNQTTTSATTSFVRDPHGTLVAIHTASASSYYLFDGQGSVVGLTSSTGTRNATYGYDSYGQLTSGTPTGIAATNPFRYDSGYQDASGYYHFGSRYYDPVHGDWTQLDPSGKNPGYTYVGDDPVNAVDHSGQDCGLYLLGACVIPQFLPDFLQSAPDTISTLVVGAATGCGLAVGGGILFIALGGPVAAGAAAADCGQGAVVNTLGTLAQLLGL